MVVSAGAAVHAAPARRGERRGKAAPAVAPSVGAAIAACRSRALLVLRCLLVCLLVPGAPAQDEAGAAPPRAAGAAAPDDASAREEDGGAPASASASPGSGFSLSLDGSWLLVLDPGDVGLREGWVETLSAGALPEPPTTRRRVPVPGPLEALTDTAFYDGVVFYRQTFELPAPAAGLRVVLRFEQVNHACRVWLDGQPVGEHEGGYDAFELDLTGRLDEGGRHVLVVRVVDPGAVPVDGLTLAGTPHAKESWYHNVGGLLGSVTLRAHAGVEARLSRVVPDPATGRVAVAVTAAAAPTHEQDALTRFTLEVERLPLRRAPPEPGTGELPVPAGAIVRVPLSAGRGRGEHVLTLTAPARWSPETPHLYRVLLWDDETLHDVRTFGFRTVRLDARGFHLDGGRRVPKGVLLQPHDTGRPGLPPSDAELEAEVAAMKEAGFDLVRAHVRPAWPAFLDAADRHGLMVLEEPAIGWVTDDGTLAPRLQHEVDWMVERDHHHPSIVLWGVLNELSGEAYRHGEALALRLAAADRTRPVLVDSGGFFGSWYVPAGGRALAPMLDEHLYPPCPLPPADLAELRTIEAEEGPTFVSEYGYGTVLDAERAARAFAERGSIGEERNLFDFFAQRQQHAREERHGWRSEGWVSEAAALSADVNATMTEALRTNPAVDLLCLTQWRAVSHEASAGLLAPWGERRPAFDAVSEALAPLLLVVHAERPSVRAGGRVAVEAVVVNDTGSTVDGELMLHGAGCAWEPEEGDAHGEAGRPERLRLPARAFPPGITRVRAALVAVADGGGNGVSGDRMLRVRAELRRGDDVLAAARPVGVAVIGARAPHAPALLVPERDERVLAFAARTGSPVLEPGAGEPPLDAVALVTRPEDLAALPPDDLLRTWRHVWSGGAALLLLNDLPDDDTARLAGRVRGTRTLPLVPVRVGVPSAAGNFLGRFHVALEEVAHGPSPRLDRLALGDEAAVAAGTLRPRLLDLDDGVLSPVSMLVEDLPEGARAAMETLGPVGNRLGTPLAALPFGAGTLLFCGLPLLDPVDGAPDPRRDALLSHLLHVASTAADEREPAALPPWTPLDELTASQLQFGLQRLARVTAFWDRYSAIVGAPPGGRRLPDALHAALQASDAALVAFATGRTEQGRAHALDAYAKVWSDETAAFLANEDVVLGLVHELLGRGAFEDLDLAARGLRLWQQALLAYGRDDVDTGQDWLGRAELLLRESLGLPPREAGTR